MKNPLVLDRRRVLAIIGSLGIGSATWQRALANQVAASGNVTPEMIKNAEWIAGLDLTDEQREQTAKSLTNHIKQLERLRDVKVGYDVPPALHFNAEPWQITFNSATQRNRAQPSESAAGRRPDSDDRLAFLPVTELAALIRSRQVTSTELTELYLNRLRRYDPLLKCVVAYTDDLARSQAARADREISAGIYRGPLHGIPWGAKDLIAYPGYPTGWGATPFRDQVLDTKATVAQRLELAGAVLIAKLSLGALAQGDKWYEGRTRNPWNPAQGSSGSSAGSASATAAGLVGFALGSETLGSIVSPCRRCGASGLRPTFGRVSRHGCMSLSWSMDKIGPIARSVEDCALILDAIHGSDGQDPTAVDRPFAWPCQQNLGDVRVGYVHEKDNPVEERRELRALRELGVQLVPIELPQHYPIWAVATMLDVEAAAVFEPLTSAGITEGLNNWPRTFRTFKFVSAVDYLRASRVRTLLIREMRKVMEQVDLYVQGNDLPLTNLTGHPTVVMPNGFRDKEGIETPTAITFTGRLFGESELLAVASAFQRQSGHHLRHPDLESFLNS